MTVRTVTARNINHAFVAGWYLLRTAGIEETVKGRPMLVAPGPVITTYLKPQERVLFSPRRDANPFFHLMESIWMLAGENDVEWLVQFNSSFSNYAEADGKQHGAYGHRWRNHFIDGMAPFQHLVFDQLKAIIDLLRRKPDTRQAVLQMWDPSCDFDAGKKDVPCNTAIYFEIRGGLLNMTVTNRSNDMLWGAYGANAVHMSFLQEFVARAVGVPIGKYHQFSNNFHVYKDVPMVQDFLNNSVVESFDLYDQPPYTETVPLLQGNEHYENFLEDCYRLIDGEDHFATKYFKWVAQPMRDFYLSRKAGAPDEKILAHMIGCDWKVAAQQWVQRRDGSVQKV